MATTDEMISKLYPNGNVPNSTQFLQSAYNSALDAQKSSLETDYKNAISDLDQQKVQNQRTTDANLNRTAVEAQKARNNNAETANAYGLTSGAAAQMRIAQNNAELSNMTTLRAKQQEQDAQIERQRGLLSDQYAAAIREAQAKNDYELATQLYSDAREKEKALDSARYYSGGGSSSGSKGTMTVDEWLAALLGGGASGTAGAEGGYVPGANNAAAISAGLGANTALANAIIADRSKTKSRDPNAILLPIQRGLQ